MNPHIELVKKFLADNDSVTEEKLRANSNDAFDSWEAAYDATWDATWDAGAAYHTAYWAAESAEAAWDAYWAAAESAEAAYWAAEDAYWAAYWATDANIPENAEYYKQKAIEAIAEYEELTK